MVDKITKSLRKLTPKEQRALQVVMKRILEGRVAGLDVQKIKGSHKIYRVRKGDLRIMYGVGRNGQHYLIGVERRTNTTYNKF